MVSIFWYLQSTYYVNLFVGYRNKAGIKSIETDDIQRPLSFDEYFKILSSIFRNTASI